MINSLYALTLTDSLHLPTAIGFFNTRQAASYARRTARLYLAHHCPGRQSETLVSRRHL